MAARGKSRNAREMARRREALALAGERMAEERRAAEEAEAARRRREEELDELVADFELARQDEQQVAGEVEEEVRRVRERGAERVRQARVVAARVVARMAEAGETIAGSARRLGVGVDVVKELRRLVRESEGGGVEPARPGSSAGGGARPVEGAEAGAPGGAVVWPGSG
ncbi:hypothetical protein ABZW18_26120 [Streptomyces sp. NPDC004647]|uniref:hypothetical protein n=1 Tax=Streptomyces sp. NPDC004647 TaxID=3154671 RepID=UPI0033AC5963